MTPTQSPRLDTTCDKKKRRKFPLASRERYETRSSGSRTRSSGRGAGCWMSRPPCRARVHPTDNLGHRQALGGFPQTLVARVVRFRALLVEVVFFFFVDALARWFFLMYLHLG